MAELTDREKKIVLIKYIIHGVSPFHDASLTVRIKMLKAAAEINGFVYDDEEWQKLGNDILDVQGQINDKLAGFLRKDPDLYKTALKSLKDGNEKITTMVDSILDQGLKKMGFGKK